MSAGTTRIAYRETTWREEREGGIVVLRARDRSAWYDARMRVVVCRPVNGLS
jgi:hypothetical protein